MTRLCVLLAAGGLFLAGAACRAGEAVAAPAALPVTGPALHPTPCCDCCGDCHAHGGCWDKVCNFFSYCRTPCKCCQPAPCCTPRLYTYFLDTCYCPGYPLPAVPCPPPHCANPAPAPVPCPHP